MKKQKKVKSSDNSALDLHGCTVVEAKEKVLDALNEALLKDVDQLRIIHGLGSGKVKDAVHALLGANRHVKNFRLEMANPGVTVVYL